MVHVLIIGTVNKSTNIFKSDLRVGSSYSASLKPPESR